MTTSSPLVARDCLFVWIWLPGRTEPVVAGRLLTRADGTIGFLYGRSYLARADAMPIYAPELPLQRGEHVPEPPMAIASCIRDAAPDAWGRRVIINRLSGRGRQEAELGELTFLAESGSDRIGALDFQDSATDYVAREGGTAPLEVLLDAADYVEQGILLPPALEFALNHGTSIGGARPKALLSESGRRWVAKFSSQRDTFSVVRAEFLLMRLAALAGLDAAPVRIVRAGSKDVLLVERFDRVEQDGDWTRRAMVSALTILGLDEMEARYASYQALADAVRQRFTAPVATLHELFGRIVLNVLGGNTDDHARNHAAFWDGQELALTPAYDLCPQQRTGGVASQAMIIHGSDRRSQVAACLDAAPVFGLLRPEARQIVASQVDVITSQWQQVTDEAGLTSVDRIFLAGRQILNPYAFEELGGDDDALRLAAAAAVRDMAR